MVGCGTGSTKPANLTGCGKLFHDGEVGVTFNHGGREGAYFKYSSWKDSVFIWECGVPASLLKRRDNFRNESNSTTYYCETCQRYAGLLW